MNYIRLTLIISLAFILIACTDDYDGRVASVIVELDESTIYEKDELSSAIEIIKQEFKNYKGSTLINLTYNEEESIQYTEEYMKNVNRDDGSVNAGLALTIYSDFRTGNLSEEMVLTSNMKYSGYNWILVREDSTSEWEVIDRGF